MTIADIAATDAALAAVIHTLEPPLAPMAMPKQVLSRTSNPVWRGFGAILSLLRRDIGRVS